MIPRQEKVKSFVVSTPLEMSTLLYYHFVGLLFKLCLHKTRVTVTCVVQFLHSTTKTIKMSHVLQDLIKRRLKCVGNDLFRWQFRISILFLRESVVWLIHVETLDWFNLLIIQIIYGTFILVRWMLLNHCVWHTLISHSESNFDFYWFNSYQPRPLFYF